MKKNKGFTLIELLAIIVILAIIAVITVPIILNIIDNSKRGAVKDSAYGYKDAVNEYYVSRLSEDKDYTIPDATYTVTATGTLSDGANTLEVTASGQMPGNNSWVTIENNKVISGCLQFDEYKVDITNGQLGEAVKGTCGVSIVRYYSLSGQDPTDHHHQSAGKQAMPDPSWTYYVKETSQSGVNAYGMISTSYSSGLGLYSESECMANAQVLNNDEYDDRVFECVEYDNKTKIDLCVVENGREFCFNLSNRAENIQTLREAFPTCDITDSDPRCSNSELTVRLFSPSSGRIAIFNSEGMCEIDSYGVWVGCHYF